ncbi:MAG TPA: hypothetical protein VMV46_03220 [Thermoanaerobaculia bacterium]|nr:hypothetical protein [Thermoanaerobaculia bacterium]
MTTPSLARAAAPAHPADPDASSLLRRALQVDAAGSALSAVVLLVGGASLAELLGAPGSLAPVAWFLVAWAAALAWLSARETLRPGAAWTVVALNVLWVVGTGFELAAGMFSPLGKAVFASMALFVAVIAEVQYLGIRRVARATR